MGCRRCGAEPREDARFCDACGSPIGDGQPAEYKQVTVLFADVVENGYLPEARAKGCGYEYLMLTRAFRREISPNIDQQMARQVLDTRWLTPVSSQPPAR